MKNLALQRIQKMKPYQPPLLGRTKYEGVLLDFNERTNKVSEAVSLSIKQLENKHKLQVYPEYSLLESKVAEYAGVNKDQVMLTNGSDTGIEIIFRTFTDINDKVIIPAPSFPMFFQSANLVGNKVVSPLYDKKSLSFPLSEVLESIDNKTKLVVVCNPNNPTGTLISVNEIESIAKKANSSIVYVDEAYFEFSNISAVELIKKYPNIVISRTFSKAFGLSSLRVGYVIADKRYIAEMIKVRGPYDINMAGYIAACASLKNKKDTLDYSTEVMNKGKPFMERFFSKNNIAFYPSGGNFILFKPDNPEEVLEKLSQSGFLLRLQSKKNIEGTLRITIGDFEQMKQFTDTYTKVILKK